MEPNTRAYLQHCGLFDGLEDAALDEVRRAASQVARQAGEFYFHQGEPAEVICLLLAGRVKLVQLSLDGQQVLMRMAAAGTLIGLISATPSSTYPVSAEAVEDCQALRWSAGAFAALAQRYPRITQNAMQMMAKYLQEYQDRLREMATERVERRLARGLLRLAHQVGQKTASGIEIAMTITRQDLAEMSGTTLFTASRILSEWERRGLIEAGREKVVILRPHDLARVAEDLKD